MFEPGVQCQVWLLERYARLCGHVTSTSIDSSQWQYFDNKDSQLELTLVSSDQILIHHGRKQLESIPLSDAHATMKGINKGDSLMIIWKINNQSRRFRMKFSASGELNGEAQSKQCVDSLAKHFSVKLAGQTLAGLEQSQVCSTPEGMPGSVEMLTGDVTLQHLAQVSRASGSSCLPSVYQKLCTRTDMDLNTMIKLCLTDPTFPAFVGNVEAQLDKIKADTSQPHCQYERQ